MLSTNPNAIHLLEQNPDKIDWFWLSLNPNAIDLLEKNQDKIVVYRVGYICLHINNFNLISLLIRIICYIVFV